MARTPDEILSVVDQAQNDLELVCPGDYDLRALVWEVINDIRQSYRIAANCLLSTGLELDMSEIDQIIDDYIANHYGDY